MDLFVSILLFVAGILLVIYGGDWFVDSASWIAKASKIPPFIIGATIVSFATTLPELIVSVLASIEGKNDIAVGNAVGSVNANTGLIMSIAFIFMVVIAPRKKFIKQYILLIASSVLLWIGSLTGKVSIWASVGLIAIFLVSIFFNIKSAKEEREETEPTEINKKTIAKNVIFFILGALAIVVGSRFLINGGSDISTHLGIPERVIAVTMVALGTSLPELVTTIAAVKKKQSHMSIGNIIGANIIDLSLILPLCSFVSKDSFEVSAKCLKFDLPGCLIILLIAILPLAFRQKASKWQGIILLLAYITYLVISL